MQRWLDLPIDESLSPHAKRTALRLNNLGSLFNFSVVTLGYNRMTRLLHDEHLCHILEREHVRLVVEWPRAHFKTTTGTISAPMWWALPFTNEDEDLMCALGYGPEWVRWMKIAHNTCTRTLIASEITKNAYKMRDKIAQHYEMNSLFKYLYPEIIPRGGERWNKDSLIHRRLNDGVYQSEGTFDFIGAEVALQSNHYDREVEDDLIGEEAIHSDSVMASTCDWHDKLPGTFDAIPGNPDALGNQLVIGNRWSDRDLSAHIRKTDKSFHFITHSAEGGCCDSHAAGQPIFPEEYTMEKLALIRQIEGDYNYACQYLNNPIDAQAVRFKSEWLRHYSRAAWEIGNLTPQNTANFQQLSPYMRSLTVEDLDAKSGATPRGLRMAMHHEVRDGEVMEDLRAADLDRVLLMDPNHSGEYGRSRNAILVLGIYLYRGLPRRIYFLDAWAEASSHERWIDAAIGDSEKRIGLAYRWKVHSVWGEFEAGGQQGWKFYLQEKLKHRAIDRQFSLRTLKTDRSEHAKTQRIIGMESVYSNGLWWMPRDGNGRQLFMDEYSRYPNGATIDLLDLAGYSPQCFGNVSRAQQREWVAGQSARQAEFMGRLGKAGY